MMSFVPQIEDYLINSEIYIHHIVSNSVTPLHECSRLSLTVDESNFPPEASMDSCIDINGLNEAIVVVCILCA